MNRTWQQIQRWCLINILLVLVPCFMAGSVLARIWPLQPLRPLLLALVLLSALAALILEVRHNRNAVFFLLPFFFLIGTLRTGQALMPPAAADDIANLIHEKSRVTLSGTLTRMVEYDGTTSRFVLSLDSLLAHTGTDHRRPVFQPASGTVRLAMRGRMNPEIEPGMHLLVIASVAPIRNYQTPGAFDYRQFMAARSIRCSGWVRSPRDVLQVRDPACGPLQELRYLPERIRTRISIFLEQRLDRTTAGLYQALLIGNRSQINPQILEQFKATGTMHLLAISGMHMGLLGLMITLTMTWLMKRSRWLLLHVHVPTLALLLSLPPLLAYGTIAGMNIPVLRALVMATLFLVAVVLQRQNSLLHLLAAAALVLLALQPLSLFTISFQLSFAAVLAIVLLYPRLAGSMPGPSGASSLSRLLHLSLTILQISVAATIGTLPLMLYHFNRFSPIGPIMNLVIEPLLCFWALPLGLVATPLIFLAPDLAALLFKTGSLAILATDKLTALAGSLPLASLWTITPSRIEIVCYFLLCGCGVFCSRIRYGRSLVLAGFSLLLIVFTSGLWLPAHPADSRITFLDVGQGTSTLLQPAGGGTVLLDGGSRTSPRFNVGDRIIAPFLWKQRLWRLDDIIITHPHADHFNGMAAVIRHFHPQRLFINSMEEGGEPGYRNILQLARRRGMEIITARAGQTVFTTGRTSLTCLGINGLPRAAGRDLNENDHGLVFMFRHGKRSILFPADISHVGEAILLATDLPLKADVLLAPHHGSRTSSSRPFISRVAPRLIVVSAGHNSRGRFPDAGNVRNWQQEGIKVLVTATAGTITCRTDGITLQAVDSLGKNTGL